MAKHQQMQDRFILEQPQIRDNSVMTLDKVSVAINASSALTRASTVKAGDGQRFISLSTWDSIAIQVNRKM